MTHALKAWADWYVSCAGGNVPHEAQAAYDAIDEIARLQKEVERLVKAHDSVSDRAMRSEMMLITVHNDAIEAAEKEAEARGAVGAADAIRALIDKDQPSTFKVKYFGAKQLECTTEGCTEDAIDHIIMGGVGSDYCLDCSDKVIAARNKDQPK